MPADCNVGALSNEGTVSGIKGSGPSRGFGSQDDQELAKIVKSLKVNIKIVGCGGSGSNTVNRCMREGIYGAEMIAANTDCQAPVDSSSEQKDPAWPEGNERSRCRCNSQAVPMSNLSRKAVIAFVSRNTDLQQEAAYCCN